MKKNIARLVLLYCILLGNYIVLLAPIQIRYSCKKLFIEGMYLHGECENEDLGEEIYRKTAIDINRFIAEGDLDGNITKIESVLNGDLLKKNENLKCGVYARDGIFCYQKNGGKFFMRSFNKLKFYVSKGRIYNELNPNNNNLELISNAKPIKKPEEIIDAKPILRSSVKKHNLKDSISISSTNKQSK